MLRDPASAFAFDSLAVDCPFLEPLPGSVGERVPRIGGGNHKGVDLIVSASYPENALYAVQPIAAGKVA